jgi:hypothetical protein
MITSFELGRSVSKLGPVAQIAWVVDDLDEALPGWIAMGVGPFYVMRHLRLVETSYYGRPVEIDMSAALGNWGDIQIELIVQHNPGDSIYNEWKKSSQKGPNHILVAAADFAAADRALTAAGGVVAQEGLAPGLARMKYFDMGSSRPYIEIGLAAPGMIQQILRMQSETAAYDGTNPIRDIPLKELQG